MFNQYFGQYLLNQGILTTKQLIEVMAHERSVRLKVGVLAVNAGLMTAAQVEEVHELQRSKDKRFGELAIQRGYLTLEQMEELLESQQRRQMTLGQSSVDLGYLSLSQLEDALLSYKEKNRLTEQSQVLNTVDFQDISKILLDFESIGSLGNIYYDYVALLLRNILRFLDEMPVLEGNIAANQVAPNWLVTQHIRGEVNLFTGLSADETALLEIGRRYSGEELPTLDALALDSVGEFLNVVNGIFCVNKSDQGMDFDLLSQQTMHGREVVLEKGFRIPIVLSFGKIELILALGK